MQCCYLEGTWSGFSLPSAVTEVVFLAQNDFFFKKHATVYNLKILAVCKFFMRKKYLFYCDSLKGDRSCAVTAYTKGTTVVKIH